MSERMQWSEAEAVVRAYRAEHGMSNDVDVATLARVLGTDVSEVRRLAGRKPRFIDRSGVLSAAIAGAVAAFLFAMAGPSIVDSNPLLASLRAPKVEVYEVPNAPRVPAIAQREIIIHKHGGWMKIAPSVDM